MVTVVMMKIKVLDEKFLGMPVHLVKSFFYSYEWFVVLFNSNDFSSFVASPPPAPQRPMQSSKLLFFSSNYLRFLAAQIIASTFYQHEEEYRDHSGCNLCVPRRSFATEERLQEHKDHSHYQCEVCPDFFKTGSERDHHLLEVHGYRVPDESNIELDDNNDS